MYAQINVKISVIKHKCFKKNDMIVKHFLLCTVF